MGMFGDESDGLPVGRLRTSRVIAGAGLLLLVVAGCGGGLKSEAWSCADEGREGCPRWSSALAVEPSRGLSWEIDEGFLLEHHTVPTILVLNGGGYLLFTSSPARGRISIHRSSDGLTWSPSGELTSEGLPEVCGTTLLDLSVRYLSNGGYRLLVESWRREQGVMRPGPARMDEADPDARPIAICGWESSDGSAWAPLSEEQFEVERGSWPSGFETLEMGDGALHYFVDTWPEVDGIRVARAAGDGAPRNPGKERLLGRSHVDPNPVRLVGGGVRLYHTHDALSGGFGFAESGDGLRFGEDRPLQGLSGLTCYTPPEQPSDPDHCLFDPFYLRLDDGRMVLYFGSFQTTEEGERRGIGRAFAVD